MSIPPAAVRYLQISVCTAVAVLLVVGMVRTSPARSTVSAALHNAAAPSDGTWTQTWGTALQPAAGTGNWSRGGFADQSLRQVVRVTAGGERVRIRLSNEYGDRPLRVAAATLGRSAGGAATRPGTLRNLAFGGRPGVAVPAGREAVSDPLPLPTSPRDELTVTLHFAEATGPATFHRRAAATAYRADGDHAADPAAAAYTRGGRSLYFLSAVETSGGPAAGTVVAFGDALADGTVPDAVARRAAERGRRLSVVDAGIAGNRLLHDSPCGGEKGLTRFRRDVLERPGVRAVVVRLGAHDLAASGSGDPCGGPDLRVPVQSLIDGHRALIRAAHEAGITAVGVTVPPAAGAALPSWDAADERALRRLNDWIRTGGAYDAVADTARTDPAAIAKAIDPSSL